MFKAKLKCANGHEQELTYGTGFTREMAEDHCTLMFGGVLHSLGTRMPGYGCAWHTSDSPKCNAVVTWSVEETEG
jgi:hypothetical protein